MSKVFEFNGNRQGTLIDSVSKTAGTLTAGSGGFKQTSKGMAMEFDGSTTSLTFARTLTGVKTIVIFSKPTTNTKLLIDNATDKLQITGGSFSGTGLTQNYVNNVDTDVSGTQWQCSVSEFSAGINFGTNVKITPTAMTHIARIMFFNTILTTIERNNLYKEFLNATQIEKTKRNWYFPKPTDLSNEDGLVAAYAFSPETVSNGTLVDISGNGNNGTINGPLLCQCGMKFDGGVSVVIPYSSSLQMESNDCTFNYRLKTGIIGANQSVWDSRDVNDDGLNILIHASGAIWVQINAIDTKTIGMVASNSEYAISIVIDRSSVVKISINGVEASYSQQPSINSQILNTSNDFSIGKNFLNTDNYQGEIQDIRIYNYAFTAQQAKDYHNSFVKPTLLEDFSDNPVGSFPNPLGTGVYTIGELASYVSQNLKIGTKYLACTSNGNIKIPYIQNTDVTASIDFYNGSTWTNYSDTLANLITTHSWLSLSGGYLIFTLTSGSGFTNLIIKNGVSI